MSLANTNSERLPAFIPRNDDDDPVLDGLGFWGWGAYEGEWSGTSTWLADAPLPEEAKPLARPMEKLPEYVEDVRRAARSGELRPVKLLAPIVSAKGWVALPVEDADYDVDPNYVAHIARAIPGGRWMVSDAIVKVRHGGRPHDPAPVLVWVVDGEARAIVALTLRLEGGE